MAWKLVTKKGTLLSVKETRKIFRELKRRRKSNKNGENY